MDDPDLVRGQRDDNCWLVFYPPCSHSTTSHVRTLSHSNTPRHVTRSTNTAVYTHVMLIVITIINIRNPHWTIQDKLTTSWQTLIHHEQNEDQRLRRVKVAMLTRMVVTLCVLLTLAASAWFMKRRGFSTFSSPVFCLQSPTYSNERDTEWLLPEKAA